MHLNHQKLHKKISSLTASVVAIFAVLASLLVAQDRNRPKPQRTDIVLTDVTQLANLDFRHADGSQGNYYLVETMSAGLALFDYDNDGDIDIYLLNGSQHPNSSADKKNKPQNALYRNEGNWKFTNVTAQAGVGDENFGLAVAIADYDNDGRQDIYLNNFGPNVLYRNRGDGTFENVTKKAGVENGSRFGAGTSFLDMDQDGDLDLYVANYVQFNYQNHVARTKKGYPIYGNPTDYPFDSDTLFRNNGDGTFQDVSKESGIAKVAMPGMGTVCVDYDNDGDTDICVANDGQANFLFQNNGRGTFKDVGLITGFAYDLSGKTHASMGVVAADYDNDGFFDLHTTSFQLELATLYRNNRGMYFDDVSIRSGAGKGTRAPVTWGNGFIDFNNDGHRDLFIACGHLYDQLRFFDQTTTYETPNLLLRNLGNGNFAEISSQAGNGLAVKASSRGAAFDDLDNDGDIDAVILNSRKRPTLLRNDSKSKNAWVQIKLKGTKSNRDAVGARIEIVAGALKQFDEVRSGRGYQGHFGSRIHFGLGNERKIDQVTVRWPSGKSETFFDIPIDKISRLTESNR